MTVPKHGPAYAIDGRSVGRDEFYAVACDPARAVVVEACAGAGKTWMLVSRIVRALLDGAAPQHILAITFTRKAAGEMRARLDEWLAEFAAADDAKREQALRARGLDAARARSLAPALGALYEQMLDAGRRVEIRTFHAWFSQLMRAAPLDLLESIGLAPGLELIDDESELEGELFRRFHAAVLADAGLGADYRALVHARGRSVTRQWLMAAWNKRVEIELCDRAEALETSVEPAAQFDARFATLNDPAESLNSVLQRDLLLRVAADLGAQKNKTPRDCADALNKAMQCADAREALTAARKALLTEQGTARAHLAAAELAAAVAMLEDVQRAADQHDACVEHRRMVRLSRALLAEYAALKRRRGLADMPDLERCALALLRDSELAGWVQQRLDAQVRHLLIDEFQDTSPLQWHALLAWLSSYAGAGGGAVPSVFIVGDPKQSIYRFRRAEPRVFAAAREFVREGLGGAVLACDHTQRNARGVLAAINATFEAATRRGLFEGFRTHTTAVDIDAPAAVALPGVERPQKAKKEEPPQRVWRDTLTQPRVQANEHFKQEEARRAAAAIAALIAEGTSPGEIMVLARTRVPLRRIALELQARHIAHVPGEDFVLRESPEVRDVIAVLDALASPGHDLSLAQALKSPLFAADDTTLLALADAATAAGGWWPALMSESSASLERARTLLSKWAALATRLPPHDLLDTIVHEGDLLARMVARVPDARRAAALAAIDALLKLALELDGARYATLYGFVRALQRRTLKAPAVHRTDAVQLLTVHGAKGLQANTVVVLDADAEAHNADSYDVLVDWPVTSAAPRRCAFVASTTRVPASLEALRDDEMREREREERNALYVAMTRAAQRLIVCHSDPHRRAETSWWPLLEAHLAPWSPTVTATGEGAPRAIVLTTLPPWGAAPAPAAPAAAVADATVRLGSALHRVLEWAGADAAAPLETLARAAAAQWTLDPAAVEQLTRRARVILTSAQCRPFFDRIALEWAGNEVPLAHDGAWLRLDRLVARREGGARVWWVLDYKLSAAPQDDPANLEQLRRYRDAVVAAQPGDAVRCAFISGAGEVIEPDLAAA